MITATLAGLGACIFEVLPRAGDIITFCHSDELPDQPRKLPGRYEVVRLEHIILDKAKPPMIFITVREASKE
jgi:hypothetical protein